METRDGISRMKVFQKGQVVIPVSLRKKYGIEIGKHVEVVETPQGILIKPSSNQGAKGPLTKRLQGIFADFAAGKPPLGKKEISKATELGYLERCQDDSSD